MLSTEFKTKHSFTVPRIELRALWMLSKDHSGLELPVFSPALTSISVKQMLLVEDRTWKTAALNYPQDSKGQ